MQERIAANIHAATADLRQAVEFRRGRSFFTALPVLLGLCAAALAMLAFGTDTRGQQVAAWAILVLVPLFAALALWGGRASAPPGLVLTPQGLELRLDGVLSVPWSAIRAIDTRSFTGFAPRLRGRPGIRFTDVTLVRLEPGFLEAERAADRFVPSGPTRDWVVRPESEGDWIALHHEDYGLTPAELRARVEARWTAFRDGAPAEDRPRPPLRLGGFRPARPLVFALGPAAGVAAILAVLANLAGLWETRAQAEARRLAERLEADRASWRAEDAARAERWADFERRMEQTFPARP